MNLWVLLPTGVGLITGLIGWLTKRSIDDIDKKIVTANKRMDDLSAKLDSTARTFNEAINDLRDEFYSYKDKVADEYVKKQDFIIFTSDFSKKLDKVYDILLDMKGRLH
jgi:uncharacterized protein YeeX (DUF496 family)